MSTTARKERKRRGTPLVRVAKVGTPIEDRVIPIVQDRSGRSTGVLTSHLSNRALKRSAEAIKIRDIDKVVEVAKPKRKRAPKKAA